MNRWWMVAAGAVGSVACASVLGIPNDTASYCSTNTGHTYCEDFDLGDPLSRMSFHAALGGAQLSIAPSDDSPPNLIDLKSQTLGPKDSQTLAGFDKEFTNARFGALRIEADMRVISHGHYSGQGGFLLITDKQGGCIGVVMTPVGIGGVSFGNPYACGGLVSASMGGSDAGASTTMGQLLGDLPPLNQWFHIKAEVTPNTAANDGSGTFTFDVVGNPTSYKPLPVVAGSLVPSGTPLVGFSAAGLPPSGDVDFQFDNITIDLSGP